MNRLCEAECCMHWVDLVYPTVYCEISSGRKKIYEVHQHVWINTLTSWCFIYCAFKWKLGLWNDMMLEHVFSMKWYVGEDASFKNKAYSLLNLKIFR